MIVTHDERQGRQNDIVIVGKALRTTSRTLAGIALTKEGTTKCRNQNKGEVKIR